MMYLEVKKKKLSLTDLFRGEREKSKEWIIYLHVKMQQECSREAFIRGVRT